MQAPREIADSRFARGEISAEEHAAILAQLGPPALPNIPPSPLPPPLPTGVGKSPTAASGVSNGWVWVGGGVAVGVIVLIAVGLSSVDGLNIGNLHAEGSGVSFKIANTSAKSGDVVLWIEQSGNTMCERVTYVAARMSYDVKFACPSLQAGQYTLHPQWAEFDLDKAAIAERIE